MSEDLRRHAAELSEADRRKSELLAMLAHELRNPLAPIRNAIEYMRRSTEANEALRRSRIDLARTLANAVEVCAASIERVGHALTTTLPREPIEVIADPARSSRCSAACSTTRASTARAAGASTPRRRATATRP